MKFKLFTLILIGLLLQATPAEALFESRIAQGFAIGGSIIAALAGLSAYGVKKIFRNKCDEMVAQVIRNYRSNHTITHELTDTCHGVRVTLYSSLNIEKQGYLDYTFVPNTKCILIAHFLLIDPGTFIQFKGTIKL